MSSCTRPAGASNSARSLAVASCTPPTRIGDSIPRTGPCRPASSPSASRARRSIGRSRRSPARLPGHDDAPCVASALVTPNQTSMSGLRRSSRVGSTGPMPDASRMRAARLGRQRRHVAGRGCAHPLRAAPPSPARDGSARRRRAPADRSACSRCRSPIRRARGCRRDPRRATACRRSPTRACRASPRWHPARRSRDADRTHRPARRSGWRSARRCRRRGARARSGRRGCCEKPSLTSRMAERPGAEPQLAARGRAARTTRPAPAPPRRAPARGRAFPLPSVVRGSRLPFASFERSRWRSRRRRGRPSGGWRGRESSGLQHDDEVVGAQPLV